MANASVVTTIGISVVDVVVDRRDVAGKVETGAISAGANGGLIQKRNRETKNKRPAARGRTYQDAL